jgi:hypothetical protein
MTAYDHSPDADEALDIEHEQHEPDHDPQPLSDEDMKTAPSAPGAVGPVDQRPAGSHESTSGAPS